MMSNYKNRNKQAEYQKLNQLVKELHEKLKEAQNFADEHGLEFELELDHQTQYFVGKGEDYFAETLRDNGEYEYEKDYGWSNSSMHC